MNNRSIAWWLRQIGLSQYTKTLEREYYGLEGLLNVTNGELKDAGIDDAGHRETILTQLSRHRQKLDPHTHVETGCRASRKYSLGSSVDLVKLRKDLFRQSVLPRLQRADKKHQLSASCGQLRPQDEGPFSMKDNKCSKKRGVSGYFSHIKIFGGQKEMDALKKELEEELKLSSEDLKSHAWYHGPLGREAGEALLERDGDFLVRDSSSTPGDYVLTCFWMNGPMHFKIIRVVLRPKQGYSRELFQFEEDRFDNVPALIRFHVGSRRPISQASSAVIFHPITRTLPLRVIREQQAGAGSGKQAKSSKRRSLSTAHADMLQIINPLLRSGSQPANLENVGRRPSLQSAQSDSNIRTGTRQVTRAQDPGPAPISPVFRTGSEPLLSPRHTRPSLPGVGVTLQGSDGQLHPRAPPKPLRISAVFPNAVIPPPIQRNEDPSSFYDELVVQIPQAKQKGHVDRLRAEEKWQSRARLTETSFGFLEASSQLPVIPQKKMADKVEDCHFQKPQVETGSCFQLDRFDSLLLPQNNRPLEPSVLLVLKELFNRSNANTTALHMLSVDCQVARITGVTEEQKTLMGVESGLELVTLPHGRQLRQDLLERHHLISLGVAVDILGCTGTVSQRAAVLHKIILLAQALKEHTHNLYSFSAVMKALEMHQITRLEMTWRALRQNHTEMAVLFEKTLKPFMKLLNEGNDSVVDGPVAVPHLVPLLMAMEGDDPVENSERGCQLLYNILQSARNAAVRAQEYQEHAHSLLTGWVPVPELLEAFQTEFALRLLWGQSGAAGDKRERYEKFDKVLSVLSNKLEPVEHNPTHADP
ncbi:breast cancer anti-estrogen resistance protein 3 homolog isoform X2 [Takifugu flavidus]|uniref:Breast cancer anti-estrogen resistance protein 3 n=1 Tax=Takifugu flavidus TaxID=433684 RepID=A0A5C6MUH3_9TELE|nr:breast cancer anti-estrogen resistance protein 3 homolog isoform X2 [Takifugu flavidus]XP_056890750.1 breast cancer anti-estrogen resistance protein 3 homolog isoform X2 [Takifugu flavidus]XP_056890751.1 breast cancer anti-estrogen resistance protein 3 homolog isoform X2 [Takifugu flavidus]TWW58902.1 Breast cancer anti-estrogen resistance protein 3 [Takifugu flavidus]